LKFLCQPSTLQISQDHHRVMIRGTMLLPMLDRAHFGRVLKVTSTYQFKNDYKNYIEN